MCVEILCNVLYKYFGLFIFKYRSNIEAWMCYDCEEVAKIHHSEFLLKICSILGILENDSKNSQNAP
jgi:hypothetical protein